MNEKKTISLREIEGPASPHQVQLENALRARASSFAHVSDVTALARFIGGIVEPLGLGEDWTVSKELFPGVIVHFVFFHADDELPGDLKVRFSGDRAAQVSADILTALSVSYIGYMGNYLEQMNARGADS
jgi:hypothetical protein